MAATRSSGSGVDMTEEKCYHYKSTVLDTRNSISKTILKIRRRMCSTCHTRFSTGEITLENAHSLKRADYADFIERRIAKGEAIARANRTGSTTT